MGARLMRLKSLLGFASDRLPVFYFLMRTVCVRTRGEQTEWHVQAKPQQSTRGFVSIRSESVECTVDIYSMTVGGISAVHKYVLLNIIQLMRRHPFVSNTAEWSCHQNSRLIGLFEDYRSVHQHAKKHNRASKRRRIRTAVVFSK
eukprot:462797-Pleurochrysis_carterae.AAC.1